ncbi:MAG: hypothetical protein Q9165_005006 [Trypethelium subeluteriae]
MASEPPIQPLPAALGLDPQRCGPQPTHLVVHEKICFSGGDFSIKDGYGQDVVVVKGKTFSIGDKRIFTTPQGQELFVMKKEHFHPIHPTWHLETPDGKKFLEVKKEWRLIGHTKLDVTFRNVAGDGGEVKLLMQGHWLKRSVDVTWNDCVVARIRKKIFTIQWMGNDTYGVEIAPGADPIMEAGDVVMTADFGE